ncbi:MAG: hypothetical protein SFY69_03530 [Planctomycetota bacterium]|nr:hypothetical protein [Planctomycetota bacterium]
MRIARPVYAAVAALCLVVLVSCDDKATPENYEKVTIGMTMGQVQGILGKGEVQDVGGMSISGAGVAGGSSQNSQVTWTWKNGNTEMSVTFDKGKVVNKSMR